MPPGKHQRARALLQAVGSDLDPDAPAAGLSVAQLQLVEIAKALRHEARVLVMDEPTAALTDAETDKLFAVIRGLTARGVSVVYISHRMPEIFAIGDRVTVMRDGATVETVAVASTTGRRADRGDGGPPDRAPGAQTPGHPRRDPAGRCGSCGVALRWDRSPSRCGRGRSSGWPD